MTPTAVKRAAEQRALPVLDMTKANYADVVAELSELKPQFVVVAAFGVILQKDLLALPTMGCDGPLRMRAETDWVALTPEHHFRNPRVNSRRLGQEH